MAKPLYVAPPVRMLLKENPENHIRELVDWSQLVSQFTKKVSVPKSVSAAYTVEAEVYWVRVDASSGAITITLPPVGTIGRPIGVIKTDSSANVVTVDGNDSETINGTTTKSLPAQYDCLQVIDNGTSWDVSFTGNFTTVASDISIANEATDTTCFPIFATAATGNIQPKSNTGYTFNSNTGQLGISTINLTGGQIVFPATQSASSDANTLDDYEEGTWTPIYTTTGTDFTSITYDAITGGRYIKIGKLVHVQAILRTDAVTVGSASGNVRIGGFPFTVASSTGATLDGRSSLSVSFSSTFVTNQPSALFTTPGGTTAELYYKATANGASTVMGFAEIGTGANANVLQFAGTYVANA